MELYQFPKRSVDSSGAAAPPYLGGAALRRSLLSTGYHREMVLNPKTEAEFRAEPQRREAEEVAPQELVLELSTPAR